MEIFKVLAIAIIGAISMQILKVTSSPIAVFVSIITGIIILIISINYLNDLFYQINYIVDKTNINFSIYSLLLKIIGVGYLVEYTCSLCIELNCKEIANKVSFFGKIFIFLLSLPIIKSVFDLVIKLV